MQVRAYVRTHRRGVASAGALLVALVGFAIYWFGPQYLFIDRRVDEALPSTNPTVQSEGAGADDAAAGAATAPAATRVLARGEFRSLEHGTSGRAALLQIADGSRFLRLEDLETSNGPDLRVYLSAAPASDDWYVYDDVAYVDLGPLKGNIGSSNYRIPDDLDLSRYRSAVVWCRRFTVGFGVAPLLPA